MPKHPPLCPKTKVHFYMESYYVKGEEYLRALEPYMEEIFPEDRECIAKYQACSWHDRAARWDRVHWRRVWTHDMMRMASWEQHAICQSNARAWRIWENQEVESPHA